ncbi:TPA: hypothetical protein N0F65_010304 [Lagenidium giganteum]|uniref:Uncharacterized protein n=1 Tax=Lagenidium giganteum TaxID=4803 RepID=A0AAV2Z8Q1_9STRA|nr:TPA: hypothetical protein N0F65_010304 [Lagenidium giganteum]
MVLISAVLSCSIGEQHEQPFRVQLAESEGARQQA